MSNLDPILVPLGWETTRIAELEAPPKEVTDSEIMELLVAFVKSQPSQKVAAENLGMSPQYLSDVLKGNRAIPEFVGGSFGYLKVSRWVEAVEDNPPKEQP